MPLGEFKNNASVNPSVLDLSSGLNEKNPFLWKRDNITIFIIIEVVRLYLYERLITQQSNYRTKDLNIAF